MDPNACFASMLSALRAGDHDTAFDHGLALIMWKARGGHMPANFTLTMLDIVAIVELVHERGELMAAR